MTPTPQYPKIQDAPFFAETTQLAPNMYLIAMLDGPSNAGQGSEVQRVLAAIYNATKVFPQLESMFTAYQGTAYIVKLVGYTIFGNDVLVTIGCALSNS